MVAKDSRRASGRTTAEVVTEEVAKTAEDPIEVQLPEERETRFQRTGFARMPIEWPDEDRIMMARIHRAVDRKVDEDFGDVLRMRYEMLELVREPVMRDGEQVLDDDGLPRWRTTATGLPVEDWTKLTAKERINWIFKLQMNIVDWEKRATEAWAEAMFAKAKWEDQFSIGFESTPGAKATVQDREARGKLLSRDERYFAIFVSYYSRMADSHVKNMRDLLLRLSQVHQAAAGR